MMNQDHSILVLVLILILIFLLILIDSRKDNK